MSTVLNLLNLPNLVTLKLFTFKVCQYTLLSHGLEICHNTYVAIVETHICEDIYQIEFAEPRNLKAIEVQDMCAQNICNFKISLFEVELSGNPS